MLPHKSLRRADVVASSAMIVLGFVVIYAASQMPWSSTLTGGDAQWYLSPGLFPTVIGVLLIVFSARILLTAVREGGLKELGSTARTWVGNLPGNRPVHRVVIITLLLVAYILLGVGRINYLIASAIFLFTAIALFWWRDAAGGPFRYIPITLVISVGVPFVISYLFSTFLNVPMP